MVLLYVNQLETRRLYVARFPYRRIPQSWMFTATHYRIYNLGHRGMTRTVAAEFRILSCIENNPNTSITPIAHQGNIPKSPLHEIQKDDQRYPYHYQNFQVLSPVDYIVRVNYWTRNTINNLQNSVRNFVHSIFYIGEARFRQEAKTSVHNGMIKILIWP